MVSASYTKAKLQEVADNSTNYAEIIKHFGLLPKGGNYKVLRHYLELYSIDMTKFYSNYSSRSLTIIKPRGYKKPIEELLVKGYVSSSCDLKKRLLTAGILEYHCYSEDCGISIWKDKKITLELDHIDGDNTNNMLSNLRLLCPNCHSLTKTWRGRKNFNLSIKRISTCTSCSLPKPLTTSPICHRCSQIKRRKIKISSPELIQLLRNNKTIVSVARILNVSDNAIRKHCRESGIDYHNP